MLADLGVFDLIAIYAVLIVAWWGLIYLAQRKGRV
jgi:hypothetical protein